MTPTTRSCDAAAPRSADRRGRRGASSCCRWRSAGAAAHGPDPVLGGGCSPRTRTCASAGAPARSRPRRSRRRSGPRRPTPTRPAASKAATFTYDAGGAEPDRLRRRARPAASTASPASPATRPDGFTMWLREQGHVFDWGTLKWCQAYASPPNGCYDAETIALDEFGHVEGLNHHVQLRRRARLPGRRGPDVLADEAGGRLEHARASGAATWRRSSSSTTCTRSTAKYSTCLDLATDLTLGASPDVDPYRRHDDAHRHAQGRRLRRVLTGSAATRSRPDRHPPAPRRGARRPGSPSARWPVGAAAAPTSMVLSLALGHRVPGGLQDARRRGHQRRHVADRPRRSSFDVHRGAVPGGAAADVPSAPAADASERERRPDAAIGSATPVPGRRWPPCSWRSAAAALVAALRARSDRVGRRRPGARRPRRPRRRRPRRPGRDGVRAGVDPRRPTRRRRRSPPRAAIPWSASSARSPGATADRTARGCPGRRSRSARASR